MNRSLRRSGSGTAYRRGRVLLILLALAGLLITTQAGAATVASQRAVTNFTFGFGYRTVPGHAKELYLRQAEIGNVGANEDVYIRCHNCTHGNFTKAKIRGHVVSFGTNPAPLMSAHSVFFIATSSPGKTGIVKAFVVRPAPVFLAESGYECIPAGVTAKQGAQNPFTVPTVACPPELVPPPLQLLIPYKGRTYSAAKPIEIYVEVTGGIPSGEYFWVGRRDEEHPRSEVYGVPLVSEDLQQEVRHDPSPLAEPEDKGSTTRTARKLGAAIGAPAPLGRSSSVTPTAIPASSSRTSTARA